MSGKTSLLGQFDYGNLGAASSGSTSSNWWGFTAIAKRQVTSKVTLTGRVEGYNDEDQVNVATGRSDPFRGNGVSAGVDMSPQPRLLWRTEVRGFFADASIFPSGTGQPRKNSGFLVSSFGLTF